VAGRPGAVSVHEVTDLSRTARLDVLVEGYVRSPHVAGTVSLIRDADRVVVVDPGMVSDRNLILGPLHGLGVRPEDVTDVVVSHHHLDHTVNIALFPVVPVHDFQSVIEGDVFTGRPADGTQLTPSVRLLATPGHTPQDITTLVGTPEDVVALTHLWWTADGPADDPYADDRELLRQQRDRVLGLATLVVPGHGAAFRPGSAPAR
jgi:glyoxylase-like metal-dependent hydrolase (beta-lactamase superfamily II)